MKVEIPVFKRCCFCLPLRYGLLAWAYFKMTADAILVSILTYAMIQTLILIRMYNIGGTHTDLIVTIMAIVIFFTDFVVTIVFIVGGHKKNVKLIRVFYFFSIGMVVITCLLTAFSVVIAIQVLIANNLLVRYWSIIVVPLPFIIVVLAVQSYFVILLRSEIIKLRNNSEFRFVNNAAEAECTMTCEEKVVGEETVKEVVIN